MFQQGVILQDPDWELVQRAQAGDRPAFSQLVLKYRHRVLGVAARMLGDRGEAEDLAQDVFVKVFKALKDFQHVALFSTWLYRITANSCLNHIQRRKQEKSVTGVLGDTEPHANLEEGPHKTLEQKQARLVIEKAIQNLPHDQRAVVILRDIEGLSYEEIAGSLEIELGTVRSRLHRARLQLKNNLRDLFPAGIES